MPVTPAPMADVFLLRFSGWRVGHCVDTSLENLHPVFSSTQRTSAFLVEAEGVTYRWRWRGLSCKIGVMLEQYTLGAV